MILNDSKSFNIIRVTKGISVDYRDNDINPPKMIKLFGSAKYLRHRFWRNGTLGTESLVTSACLIP